MTSKTNHSPKNILFDLPVELQFEVITSWVSLDTVCQLDTACTNHQYREDFLHLLSSPFTIFGSVPPITCHALEYIVQRKITIRKCIIQKDSWQKWKLPNTPSEQEIVRKVFSEVRILSIDASSGISQEQMLYIMRACAMRDILQFQEISLLGFRKVKDCDLLPIITQNSPKKRSLSLDRTRSVSSAHTPPQKYDTAYTLSEKKLSLQVNLQGCWKLSSAMIQYLLAQQKPFQERKLVSLDISTCFHFSEQALGNLLGSAHCSELKILKMSYATNITDEVLSIALKHCPQLEILHLSACIQITNKTLSNISKYGKNIQELDLSLIRNITDIGLDELTKTNPPRDTKSQRLKSINLQGCQRITADGVKNMIVNIPSLQKILLKNCFCVDYTQWVKEVRIATASKDDLEIII